MMRKAQPHLGRPRRGTLLLAVLACLTLCAMLLTFWLRLIAMERRQLRNHHAAMQTELLTDAAIARAQLRSTADPAYTGETWQPSAGALASPRATITIANAAEGDETRQLTVAAELGVGTMPSVRRTRTIALPKSEAMTPTPTPLTPDSTPAEEPAS